MCKTFHEKVARKYFLYCLKYENSKKYQATLRKMFLDKMEKYRKLTFKSFKMD